MIFFLRLGFIYTYNMLFCIGWRSGFSGLLKRPCWHLRCMTSVACTLWISGFRAKYYIYIRLYIHILWNLCIFYLVLMFLKSSESYTVSILLHLRLYFAYSKYFEVTVIHLITPHSSKI